MPQVVFATTAGQSHVSDPTWFEHSPLVLHVSLRDLAHFSVACNHRPRDPPVKPFKNVTEGCIIAPPEMLPKK